MKFKMQKLTILLLNKLYLHFGWPNLCTNGLSKKKKTKKTIPYILVPKFMMIFVEPMKHVRMVCVNFIGRQFLLNIWIIILLFFVITIIYTLVECTKHIVSKHFVYWQWDNDVSPIFRLLLRPPHLHLLLYLTIRFIAAYFSSHPCSLH